jgi:hypothetical protein
VRAELLLEELLHHLQPDPDREREQSLAHRARQVVEGKLDLGRQPQPVELVAVGDPSGLVVLHRAVLLIEWLRSPPYQREGRTASQNQPSPGQALNVHDGCNVTG